MKNLTAEVIAVGTELLLGDIVNSNAAFLGRELAKLGIAMYTQTVVGDNPARLKRAYAQAFERGANLIIATGGLGPTEDDITKEVAAEFFDMRLVLHEESWEALMGLFKKMNSPVAASNKKQAMLPEGCTVLPNPNGSAPGCCMEKDGKMMILLPGPPNELIPMFLEGAVPILRKMSDTVLVSRTLKVVGIGESMLEERIKPIIAAQDNPTIAPYAKTAEVHLRITASATEESKARAMIEPVEKKLREIIGTAIYGEDNDTIESVVSDLLKARNFTLACAESCTGGMMVARLVNHPGISDVLQEGIVTYANESKVNRLGIDAKLIELHGAVSAEVAAAMAEGVAKTSGADVGLSTTGIAGPGGATADKPVGRVYMGIYIPGVGTKTKEITVTGDRMKVRNRATIAALDFLRQHLLGN